MNTPATDTTSAAVRACDQLVTLIDTGESAQDPPTDDGVAEALAARPPMPTASDIVEPIARGLFHLHDLGVYNLVKVDGLTAKVETGMFHDEAAEIIALADDVAALVEAVLIAVLPAPQPVAIHAANMRALIMTLFDIDDLRSELRSADIAPFWQGE